MDLQIFFYQGLAGLFILFCVSRVTLKNILPQKLHAILVLARDDRGERSRKYKNTGNQKSPSCLLKNRDSLKKKMFLKLRRFAFLPSWPVYLFSILRKNKQKLDRLIKGSTWLHRNPSLAAILFVFHLVCNFVPRSSHSFPCPPF